MATSFRHVAPDRLRIREGGGCMAIFGLPFLAAGLFLVFAALGVIRLNNATDQGPYTTVVLSFMGIVFTVVGACLVFLRTWIIVDATQRTVTKEWGLMVPMRGQIHRLDDCTAVMLGFEGGDSDSADRFPVVLKSRSGRNLPLCTSTQYAESRACATAVGQLLQFEIEDASSDHPTRIAPTHADLSLQERVRLERTREEHAERPAAARSEVTEQGGVVRIVIPMPRLHPVLLAGMLIPVGIALIAVAPLAQFFRQTQTPAPVSRVFLGFLGFAFVLLPATSALSAFLRSRWGRTIVTVTTEGIRIEQRGAVRTKTIASFTVSEVVDVDFSTTLSTMDSARRAAEQRVADAGRAHVDAPVVGARTARVIAVLSRFARGRGVILKTRRSLTSFGEGLADEEVRYLHAVVRRALIGERATGR